MRAILSKVVAVSMIAGASLLVSACGGETTVNTTNTTEVTDVTVENAGAEETMTGPVDAANATENAVVTANTSETTVTTNAM